MSVLATPRGLPLLHSLLGRVVCCPGLHMADSRPQNEMPSPFSLHAQFLVWFSWTLSFLSFFFRVSPKKREREREKVIRVMRFALGGK